MPKHAKEKKVKIVLVGDGNVGKTSLCLSYTIDHFPWGLIPTECSLYSCNAVVGGKPFAHSVIDTSNQGERYYQLRPLNYPGTDIFMMLFSVENRSSLESIEGRWLPEIRHHMPDTPILLVATKIDLRGSSQHDCITFEEGFNLAQKHNFAYTETSAVLNTNGKDHAEQPIGYCGPNHEEVDVFHLYFSVRCKSSLANVESRWIPEIRHAMPDIPILLVATKIDYPWSAHRRRIVSCDEGLKVAKKHNVGYTEMTGLLNMNLKDCFEKAVYIADEASKPQKKKGFGRRKQKARPPEQLPPEKPPLDEAPRIEIQTSTIAGDLGKALEQPSYSDVTFIVEGKSILAHKVMLCSASNFFCVVFGLKPPDQDTGSGSKVWNFTWEDINEGKIAGLAGILDVVTSDGSSCDKPKSQVTISEDISYKTFRHVLEFLYTDLPNIPEGASAEDIVALQMASSTFCLPMLDSVIKNLRNVAEFLNPSIGTFLNDQTGQRAKRLFLNNQELSDIRFKVEDQTFFVHKILLTSRCEIMARMFSGVFTESNKEEIRIEDVSTECFLALLEYLYTDHAPIEEGDAVGIMVAADRYGQERLKNLCELYITKGVDVAVANSIAEAHVDVIGLLHTAQMYNATQLATWCLHFISSNFMAFKQRAEFKTLEGENLKYISENRWPPVNYLEELEKYNANCGQKEEKS
ncbi:rho-related protein racA-like [Patiria miniata]|uniref:BTB domain-containing protein n=1 Tax=Patiria miniata TaxID=46514 RepID=A0A914BLC0_PATMI|nr:rho-related protein racA-like [Patiria miniata]XP_038076725.1 rho-related protein racA-like [Patiria miniata]XP_038076726.1 rho-related protein racA-like [Patiria miniata]